MLEPPVQHKFVDKSSRYGDLCRFSGLLTSFLSRSFLLNFRHLILAS